MTRTALAALATALLAAPLRAECVGPNCYDGLAVLVFGVPAYGLLGLVILIMLIRRKWRSAGWKLLAAVALIGLGVPLATQGWQAWKQVGMEGREIVGQPPAMTERVPLLILSDGGCYQSTCAAVVRGKGKSGVYLLWEDDLQGLDLTQPLALDELPLEQWVELEDPDLLVRTRELSPEERKDAAARLDYVIILAQRYSRPGPGALEAALQGVGSGETVRLAMAPLDPAKGVLSMADLRFDVLDLSLAGGALAVPLVPYHWRRPVNVTVGTDVMAQALCPTPDGRGDAVCRDWLLQ